MHKLSFSKLSFISIVLFLCNSTFAQTTTTAPVTPTATAAPTQTKAIAPAANATPAPAKTTPAAPATTTASAPAPAAPRPKAPAPAAKPVENSTPAGYTGPVWKKQIVRDIEMGEKIDSSVHRLRNASPDNTLLEMFAIGIKTGKISSFYTSDFSMATRIRPTDFDKLFVGRPDTIAVRDASGKYVPKIVRKNFNYSEAHKYRILEEWTSYPGIGKTEIQVVGIAPLKDIKGDDGTPHGVEPIFWVHFTDDIKAIVARYEQYHPNNTLGGHIWDEYFNSSQK